MEWTNATGRSSGSARRNRSKSQLQLISALALSIFVALRFVTESYVLSRSTFSQEVRDLVQLRQRYLRSFGNESAILESIDRTLGYLGEDHVLFDTTSLSATRSLGQTEEDKPSKLILHVGPGKMGTTYLQCTLQRNSVQRYLEQDAYLFIGKVATVCNLPANEKNAQRTESFAEVGDFFNPKAPRHLSDSFLKVLRDWRNQGGRNAIVVSEHLSSANAMQLEAFKHDLKEHNWEVHVLVGYRKFYDWLPSRYSQEFKPKTAETKKWPDEGGRLLEPFHIENRGSFSTRIEHAMEYMEHPTLSSASKFREIFEDVSIIPLPYLPKGGAGDAYLVYLVCNLLEMEHTCAAATQGRIGVYEERTNPSYPIVLDWLATQAHNQGLLRPDLSRREAVQALRLADLPSAGNAESLCLEKATLEKVLNVSLEMEALVLSTRDHWESNRRIFWDEVVPQKYCHVDSKEVMISPAWKALFWDLGAITT